MGWRRWAGRGLVVDDLVADQATVAGCWRDATLGGEEKGQLGVFPQTERRKRAIPFFPWYFRRLEVGNFCPFDQKPPGFRRGESYTNPWRKRRVSRMACYIPLENTPFPLLCGTELTQLFAPGQAASQPVPGAAGQPGRPPPTSGGALGQSHPATRGAAPVCPGAFRGGLRAFPTRQLARKGPLGRFPPALT